VPPRPLRLCSTPGCPSIVHSGYCPSCVTRRGARTVKLSTPTPTPDNTVGPDTSSVLPSKFTRNHTHKPFYNSSAWRLARSEYIIAHPICEICHRKPSREVHHVKSIEEYPELKLDPTNFQATCTPCHSRETVRVDGGFGRKRATE